MKQMVLKLNIAEDDELREYIKALIKGQVRSIVRDEIKNIVKDIAGEKIDLTNIINEVVKEKIDTEIKRATDAGYGSSCKTYFQNAIKNAATKYILEAAEEIAKYKKVLLNE